MTVAAAVHFISSPPLTAVRLLVVLEMPLFDIAALSFFPSVRPPAAHKGSFFAVYHCRHSLARPPARQPAHSLTHEMARVGLRGKVEEEGGGEEVVELIVGPSCGDGARARWRQERERERERGLVGNGHCLQLRVPRPRPALKRESREQTGGGGQLSSQATILTNGQPAFPPSLPPSHEKENTRSWKVGRRSEGRKGKGRRE